MHLTPFPRSILSLLLCCAGCHGPTDKPDDTGPDTGPVADDLCTDAEAFLGYRACVTRVPDDATFEGITISGAAVDQLRTGKHLVPARDDARLPPIFLDVNNFPIHYDLLIAAFPDVFPGLTHDEYNQLILPAEREFLAGLVALFVEGSETFYGFTLWDDPADESSTITQEAATRAWKEMGVGFTLADLSFVPSTPAQIEAAATWTDAPFDIRGMDTDIVYEVYNPGTAYGTIRFLTLKELAVAEAEASFGYQDILVLDQAPVDIERVIAGAVTGTRQGELSHLNVRSASRGTPNCYVLDPFNALTGWEGVLVSFTCGESTWSVATTTLEEAEAWWDSIRPDPVDVPEPVLDVTEMPGLLELATSTESDRSAGMATYGAKGTNLATLYQLIDAQYQIDGFVIPFHYYDAFMHDTTWTVDLGQGKGAYSFADTLDAWIVDATFTSDGAYRQERLQALRDAIQASPVDPAIIEALTPRIMDVFGGDDVMVRFRSSSNAEDAIGFSGAGLYESESGCLADETDADGLGPSWCDLEESAERTVTLALTEVWASLWKTQAWEERDWYGMDQSKVAMGVLVDTRAKDELANIVAFTGNPTTDGDDRYLINAQVGDLDVVSADPGVVPEKILLTLSVGGVVTLIERVSPSSEVPEGEVILDDAVLDEMGAELWTILQIFPVDGEIPKDRDLLLDTEWKILSDGRLIIKQVRPYLR